MSVGRWKRGRVMQYRPPPNKAQGGNTEHSRQARLDVPPQSTRTLQNYPSPLRARKGYLNLHLGFIGRGLIRGRLSFIAGGEKAKTLRGDTEGFSTLAGGILDRERSWVVAYLKKLRKRQTKAKRVRKPPQWSVPIFTWRAARLDIPLLPQPWERGK
jgi:hypothetical protein